MRIPTSEAITPASEARTAAGEMRAAGGEAADFATPLRDNSRTFGAILVEQGRISPTDSEEILQFAAKHRLRFGDAGLRLKLLTQEDIDFAVAHQFNYPLLPRGGRHGVADCVVAAYNPQNERVEPLRALRSQLALRWFNDANHKMIAITSPSRGEGRSWIAANLAVVFAQIGERTLLIDADMRHPRQHQLFNLHESAGLSALLTGRAGKEIASRIHPQLRLFVPAGGRAAAEPAGVAEPTGIRPGAGALQRPIRRHRDRHTGGCGNRGRTDRREPGRCGTHGGAAQRQPPFAAALDDADDEPDGRQRHRKRHR